MIHLPLPTTKSNTSPLPHYMASIHGSGMKDTGSLQANHIINDTGSLQPNHITKGGEENDRTEHGT